MSESADVTVSVTVRDADASSYASCSCLDLFGSGSFASIFFSPLCGSLVYLVSVSGVLSVSILLKNSIPRK